MDRHFQTIVPAIRAGKDVLVEWPLGKNLEEASELLTLSKEHSVKLAAVGCQGRFDSTFRTVQKLLDDGKIGKVLSTTVVGPAMNGGPVVEPPSSEYLSQIEVGGNVVTIPFGHFVDSFTRGTVRPCTSALRARTLTLTQSSVSPRASTHCSQSSVRRLTSSIQMARLSKRI